jgi:hypothetical protein
MASFDPHPAPTAARPVREPLRGGVLRRTAAAWQAAVARSHETDGRLPPGIRIIDGERLYSAAWL